MSIRASKLRKAGLVFGLALLMPLAAGGPAGAGSVLDRVRTSHTLKCALEERAGFAEQSESGAEGFGVDLCRAVAIAVLDASAKVEISLPAAGTDFDALKNGDIDFALVSSDTIADQKLSAVLLPGPVAFIDPLAVMVPENSKAVTPADLTGATFCFMIGSPAQRAFESVLGDGGLAVIRSAFEEDVEMLDAYNVGNCDAVVEHETRLAEMRQTNGINRLKSRILAPPLALTPFRTQTPEGDGAWAAMVAHVIDDLIDTAKPASRWAMEDSSFPGLRPQWRSDVLGALGTFAEMRDRHLGPKSPYDLVPWPNAPWPAGLLMGRGLN